MGSHFKTGLTIMGLHFQQSSRVTRMGSQIVGILGVRKFWLVGFKNGKIRGKKKKLLQKEL